MEGSVERWKRLSDGYDLLNFPSKLWALAVESFSRLFETGRMQTPWMYVHPLRRNSLHVLTSFAQFVLWRVLEVARQCHQLLCRPPGPPSMRKLILWRNTSVALRNSIEISDIYSEPNSKLRDHIMTAVEHNKSSSNKESQRQKDQENSHNPAIDKVMEMIGLYYKRDRRLQQIHTAKDRIDEMNRFHRWNRRWKKWIIR